MININNLTFSYPSQPLLFDRLNLELKEGHIYGLLGKNGAGKSTLLKNIAGLAFPKKGDCMFRGINMASRLVQALEDIYFIPEDMYNPHVSPSQFTRNTSGFYPKFNETGFVDYLKMLDVDRNAKMDTSSYGQQKKTMIAFGLATNTSLLIMDEPTNGLDIPSKIQFRKLIASIQSENRCIVISTHQVRDLDSLIDTLLILHEKEIVLNNSIDEIVDKLIFGVYPDTTGLPVLYEEENIRGKSAILANHKGEFSKVDMELLFNAIILGNTPLLQILKAH